MRFVRPGHAQVDRGSKGHAHDALRCEVPNKTKLKQEYGCNLHADATDHGVPTMLLPCGAPAPLKESLELK